MSFLLKALIAFCVFSASWLAWVQVFYAPKWCLCISDYFCNEAAPLIFIAFIVCLMMPIFLIYTLKKENEAGKK